MDCPEFVMIDTINGAVQSEINSQWLKMTKNVSFFGQKSCKRRLLQGVPTSFGALKGQFRSFRVVFGKYFDHFMVI